MEKRKYQRFSVGDVFGRLTIISQDAQYAECQCKCGNVKRIAKDHMRSGATSSCGCHQKQRAAEANSTHGKTSSGTYKSWSAMVQRCTNPNSRKYSYYGGRGVKVCAQWLSSFDSFLEDMGSRPDGMSIDRIDSDGDYEPDNCKWSTRQEQAINTRQRNTWVVNGISYRDLTEASIALGVSRQTVRNWCCGYSNNGRKLPAREGCSSTKLQNQILGFV